MKPASPFHTLLLVMVTITTASTQSAPNDWQFRSQRPEIAPDHSVDHHVTFAGQPTYTLQGGGKAHAAGYWHKTVPVNPGDWYQFKTHYQTSGVDEPARVVLARIVWQDANGDINGRQEYPVTLETPTANGWQIIAQSFQAPEHAQAARLELHYRWDGDGMVRFGGTTFDKTNAPAKRLVRLASVHHRPRNSASAMDNLKAFAKLVDEAGAQRADIVCLPEGVTLVGTKQNYISASEPVPGPTTQFLGEVARRNNLYIVAGLLEREGEVVYNTAVLIDRQGNLAGKYRKTSLPREEIDGGVTPGNAFPVFDTDFGRIGIMICWDVSFPEPARALARQGAEVILLPIWGGDLNLAKARAIENQVYVVSSTYDMITGIIGLEGQVLQQARVDKSIALTEVDLNAQKVWPWLGDFRNRIFREIPSQEAVQSVLSP